MRKAYLLILTIMLVLGCREPIELDVESSEPKLVIDGFITDSFHPHSVFLSFSSGFQEGIYIPNRITTAVVTIEDDQGGSFNLNHIGNGEYRSISFFAEENKSYRVVVQLEGAEYATTFERLPENDSPALASLSYLPELKEQVSGSNVITTQQGVGVYASIAKGSQTVFYQWVIERWYIANASGDLCYARDFDVPRATLLEDQARQVGEGERYDFQIDFVPVGVKTEQDFAVVATQLILTQEAYEFWNQIQSQTENVGSLFDSAPFTVRGNASNMDTKEPVLGYFGVYRESVARTFFSEAELPYPDIAYPCNPPPITPNICTDCTLWPSTNISRIKPTWWR